MRRVAADALAAGREDRPMRAASAEAAVSAAPIANALSVDVED